MVGPGRRAVIDATVPGRVTGAHEDAARVVMAVDGGGHLTHGAWQLRSNAVASGLAARGVGAGSRVALRFDASRWVDFAVAWLGVRKAGAMAVLLSPGAAPAELARALADSGASGLVGPPHPARPTGPGWVADLGEIERGRSTDAPAGGIDLDALVEVVYPPAPLAPPVSLVGSHREPAGGLGPDVEGWFVHAWAPGSAGGQYALRQVRGGRAAAVSLGTFDCERLYRVVAERRATACGLTPALAAAVVAGGAAARHDLSSVTRVVLSGPAGTGLRAGLEAAFSGADITVLGAAVDPCPVAGGAPVAVSQEGMLWHEQFAPGSFNLPCLVRRYRGPLDLGALEGALAELTRRHQPLRSRFAVVEGRPRQVVGGHGPLRLVVEDLSALGADGRDERAAAALADASGRPFDLVTGPLFEPRLVRLGDDDHLLVIRLHHTVFDDWSVDVLRRELSALYTARLAGAPTPLVEPTTSFADACRRQRAALSGERGAAERSWWGRELAGAPLAVQLPIGGDDPDPEPGDPLRVDLPPSLAAGLRALAPALRATPFMTVLAAFSVLLCRATGQDDLVIATVVAHRDSSDVEPLIGCFTKKIPLRLRVGGDPTFPELVARTRAVLLGALAHQDLAFDAAVQEGLGRPAADHGVVATVAVVFQGETPQRVRLDLPGLSIGPYAARAEARRERHFSAAPQPDAPPARGGSPVWGDGMYLGTFLILSLLETPEGLSLVARGVFDRPAARAFLADFEALLVEVVADPARPVSALQAGMRTPPGPTSADVELRGFRASRPRIEAALARCPGVAEVAVAVREDDAGEPQLVAYVVVDPRHPPPTLVALRHALWVGLPGVLWPAAAVVVDALVRRPDGALDVSALPRPDRAPVSPGAADPTADPTADLLCAMWSELGGRKIGPHESFWQDFSFLQVLAEAREAGLVLDDRQVARCRTPAMLSAAHAAAPPPPVA